MPDIIRHHTFYQAAFDRPAYRRQAQADNTDYFTTFTFNVFVR